MILAKRPKGLCQTKNYWSALATASDQAPSSPNARRMEDTVLQLRYVNAVGGVKAARTVELREVYSEQPVVPGFQLIDR
jgi:hypothetical protein